MTHSLRFLPEADSIIVMGDGKISEMGSYKQLMENKGEFAQLVASFVNEGQQEVNQEKEVDQREEEQQLIR